MVGIVLLKHICADLIEWQVVLFTLTVNLMKMYLRTDRKFFFSFPFFFSILVKR